MNSEGSSSFTWRSLALAFGISFAGALIANYHDGAIAHRDVSQHHYLAPLALAFCFFFLVLINAAVRRLKPGCGLGSGELAVALTLALMATPLSRFLASSWVSIVGFTPSLIDVRNLTLAPLVRTDLLQALPDGAVLDAAASRQFDDGMGARLGAMVPPAEVPWQVWIRPALFWAPLMAVFLSLCVSMGYVLYRQWAERELVPFPLAEFGADLVRHDGNRVFPVIFYQRSFWMGFSVMVLIFAINGIQAHIPNMIAIPTKFQFYELASQFSFLRDSHEGYSLLRGWAFFAVVAVAVMLPSEISFTAWFTWPLMVVGTYLFYVRTGERFGANAGMMSMGAVWAMAGMILYAGRTYYLGLLKRALGRRVGSDTAETGIDTQSVRICRVFLLSVLALIAILIRYGIPWDLAIVWTLILLVLFLVACRLVAEMGIPWLPLGHLLPLPLMLMAFGEQVMGPKAYALLAIFSCVLLPQRTTMLLIPPMVANALHVEARVTRRLATPAMVAPFLGIVLILSVAIAVWMGYSSEGSANDYPGQGLQPVTQAAETIGNVFRDRFEAAPAARDVLAFNPALSERWSAMRVHPRFPPMFAFGAFLVLATGAARLRFPRFPLHPLPLVLLGSWTMSRLWFSFLLGWLIKKTILKVGGGRLFERSRPFFGGIIIGLATIYTFWILANIVIYWNNHYTFRTEWLIFLRDIFNH